MRHIPVWQVRGQAGRALTAVAASLGPPEAIRLQDARQLLRAGGTLISDNTPDARTSARELISLSQVTSLSEYNGLPDSVAKLCHAAGCLAQPQTAAHCLLSMPGVKGPMAFLHVVQAAFTAAGHANGKENSVAQVPNGHPAANGMHSPSKSVPTTWDAFCRASLSGTAALAVLRVSSK